MKQLWISLFGILPIACGPTEAATDPIVAVQCGSHNVINKMAGQPSTERQQWFGLVDGMNPKSEYYVETCDAPSVPYEKCNGRIGCSESGLVAPSGEACVWQHMVGEGVFVGETLLVPCGIVDITRDANGVETSRTDLRPKAVFVHRI